MLPQDSKTVGGKRIFVNKDILFMCYMATN
jgi:hypothetical protein